MKRRGFTIIEMLMVIGILSILIGIITTAASQSMQAARSRRAEAAKKVVQTALGAYYAANDDWPVSGLAKRTGNHKNGNVTDESVYDLTADEVRTCVKALVMATKNGNPFLDVTGLWVSRSDGNNPNRKDLGMDFWSAIRGTRKSSKKMKLADMYFGYPRTSDGGFERFGMGYSIPGDMLIVGSRSEHLGASAK